MRRAAGLLLIFFFISANLLAQPEITKKFLFRQYTYQGMTIPYRLFVPEHYDPSKKYPLVLTLHGSGERGSNNTSQIDNYRIATVWADSVNQSKYPCFVLSPQCPANGTWFNSDQIGTIDITRFPQPKETRTVMEILDRLIEEFNIDTTRLYITGLSLGGFGTWDLIARYPDKFAAAVPMSGGGDVQHIGRAYNMPVWNFHGVMDNAVPVFLSRNLIVRLQDMGRSTMFTHCNINDCTALTEKEISERIESGVDLIETEYPEGGHVIWDESYNNPHLLPWVFKQRNIKGTIEFRKPFGYTRLKGIQTIEWTTEKPGGTVSILCSPDNGTTYYTIASSIPNTGSFQWETAGFEDAAFARLRIVARDEANLQYGSAYSPLFCIDNPAKGKPYVQIMNEGLNDGGEFTNKALDLKLLAGDPENDTLIVSIYFSTNGGSSFSLIDSYRAASDSAVQIHPLDFAALENSNNAVLRVDVSDGEFTSSDVSVSFIKRTEREFIHGQRVVRLSGNTGAEVRFAVIDESKLTGNDYLITFNDTASAVQKYFSVFNIDKKTSILKDVPFSSGRESQVFDGLALLADDFPTSIDVLRSGWNSSSQKKLNFSVSPFGNTNNRGYALPDDYRIEIYAQISDTSQADTLLPKTQANIYKARPVSFKVYNMTKQEYVDFVYYTTGTMATAHTVYFREKAAGRLFRTWRLTIYDTQLNAPLPAGDTLYLVTKKGLSIFDSLKVSAPVVSVKNKEAVSDYRLYQNYPNPFNPATTIRFSVPEAGRVSVGVYNILGSEVAVLWDAATAAGEHSLSFNAGGLPSGVYFCRMQAGNYSAVRKLLLLK